MPSVLPIWSALVVPDQPYELYQLDHYFLPYCLSNEHQDITTFCVYTCTCSDMYIVVVFSRDCVCNSFSAAARRTVTN